MVQRDGTRDHVSAEAVAAPLDEGGLHAAADTGLLAVSVSHVRGALVVALRGDADMSAEPVLRSALQQLTAEATEPMIIDLSEVAFCDLRGLTALIGANATATKRGVGFALAGMTALQARVWRIAFADNVPARLLPPLYPDLDAALNRMIAPAPRARRDTQRERSRLAAVRRYDILDTPPDGAFDRITALAARLFGVPIAIVSIVDADRIWFKSHHGLDVDQVGRDPGLCASAILEDGPWLIEDAATDARALANPLVAGEFGLRFYAGVPLTTHDGHNLGTLCVLDRQARAVSPPELATLTDLAALVMSELELRLSARRAVADKERLLADKEAAGRDAQTVSRALQESLLPRQLPAIAGLELVARYHVAEHDLVGGDFYDVIAAGSGCVAVSGDVSGKGTLAAARTAEVRWTLRALLSEMTTPASALRRLNEMLTRTDSDPGRSCTIALATLQPRPEVGFKVTVSLAGHPKPLVVRRGGAVEAIGGDVGAALGWLDEPTFADAATELEPGDVLLMFTDGLVEAVAGHGNVDDTALRDLLQSLAGATAKVVANRLDAVVARSVLRDDAAFLAIRAT